MYKLKSKVYGCKGKRSFEWEKKIIFPNLIKLRITMCKTQKKISLYILAFPDVLDNFPELGGINHKPTPSQADMSAKKIFFFNVSS